MNIVGFGSFSDALRRASSFFSGRSRRYALAAVALALMAGCTVGPDYQRPQPPLPETFDAPSNASPPATDDTLAVEPLAGLAESTLVEELAWWRGFSDPVLAELVERAMRANLDLEVALARVAEARAARRAQGGRLWPVADGSVSGGRSRASARGPGPLSDLAEAGLASLENEQYAVGVAISWELDLFGRVRRAREAAQARLEGAEEQWRGAALLVAAETANAYISLRGIERRLTLAERNLRIQSTSLDVIDGKVNAGLSPPIDRERSRAQEASLRAAIAPLQAQRAAARYQLAVLLGELPNALDETLGEAEVPRPPSEITAGLPASLILRRPDLRAAERELHAATAEIGVAIGDRLPRVSLGGSLGLESATLSDLLRSASHTWSFGPRVDLPLFRGGALKAGVEGARARLDAADATYRLAILQALAEVQSAMAAREASGAALDALQEASLSSARAAEYASVLYDEGLRDHLVLLDAQRAQTGADDALASAEADVALRAVTLYRALGGGWAQLERLALPQQNAAGSEGFDQSAKE